MATGAFTLYDSGHLNFWNGKFDFANDTIVAALLSNSYSASASDSTWKDVKDDEISDGDYSRVTVSNASVTKSGSTVTLDCDKVNYGNNVSIEAKWIVFVQQSGGSISNSDNLIAYGDLDTSSGTATTKSINSEFSVSPHASGLLADDPA